MVPPRHGAAYRRHGSWRHGVRCRLRPARCPVPPNGAAQNRLAKARLKTGGGPAARRPDRAGGNGAARLGGTEDGAANRRHGSWRRGFGPLGTVRRLADRVGRAADRNWGFSGRGCGVWECGCPGTRSLGMRMSGNADVRECGCPGMRSPGMRSLGEMRSPGTARRPIGRRERCRLEWCRRLAARYSAGQLPGTEYGAARSGGTEWCRLLAALAAAWNGAANRRHGSGGGQQSRRPIGRRQRGGVACVGTLGRPGVGAPGRPGVLPSCGTAGAARPVWCRLGMVPPIGGAVHGGTVLPGGCGPAWIWCLQLEARFRADPSWCRAAWCLQLEARFPGGAVPWRRGSGDCAGPGEGACQKTVCWPGWLGRAPGVLLGALLGAASGERGLEERCLGERRLGVRRRGAGNGAWKNGAGGTASGGAGYGKGKPEQRQGIPVRMPGNSRGTEQRGNRGCRGRGLQKGMRGKCRKKAS